MLVPQVGSSGVTITAATAEKSDLEVVADKIILNNKNKVDI